MVSQFFLEDKLNRNENRNKENTALREYNCGGWALNTFSWYRPTLDCFFEHWGVDWGKRMSDKEMFDITLLSVNAMLREFEDLRVIRNLNELKEDEYALAFRIGQDLNDFHYCKRSRNGHWTHKMGGTKIQPIAKKDVFSESWCNGYCGHIVLMAKKLPKNIQKTLTIKEDCDIIVIQGRKIKL